MYIYLQSWMSGKLQGCGNAESHWPFWIRSSVFAPVFLFLRSRLHVWTVNFTPWRNICGLLQFILIHNVVVPQINMLPYSYAIFRYLSSFSVLRGPKIQQRRRTPIHFSTDSVCSEQSEDICKFLALELTLRHFPSAPRGKSTTICAHFLAVSDSIPTQIVNVLLSHCSGINSYKLYTVLKESNPALPHNLEIYLKLYPFRGLDRRLGLQDFHTIGTWRW